MLQPNNGKNLSILVDNVLWDRLPVKTHIITDKDLIAGVVKKYVGECLETGDLLFISERIVAISQGRAFPIKDIKPSCWAKWLVKFVHRSPYGIGLGSPWTMELAIREAGLSRILLAAFCSAVTKPFGLRGVFYHVVGKNINAIDGPCSYTLPPYNEYAKLGPLDPDGVAKRIKERLGAEVVIIDSNDLGVNVLGRSADFLTNDFCQKLFADNPLGQASEQTPICLVRMRR